MNAPWEFDIEDLESALFNAKLVQSIRVLFKILLRNKTNDFRNAGSIVTYVIYLLLQYGGGYGLGGYGLGGYGYGTGYALPAVGYATAYAPSYAAGYAVTPA